jgi:hypothetical protein
LNVMEYRGHRSHYPDQWALQWADIEANAAMRPYPKLGLG